MMSWSTAEAAVLSRLTHPASIQEHLDALPYNAGTTCRSPRGVIRYGIAHCMEGALFAAAALERLGHPPLLVNIRAVRDDDHVIAIFRYGRRLGAVAKSNYAGLRYRSPVYRSVRELVVSYFDHYFNTSGELTMRAYSRPLDLRARRFSGWQWAEDDEYIGDALDRQSETVIVDARVEPDLRPVDARLLKAGLLGANPEGLFKV
jgi:hypothetical protein